MKVWITKYALTEGILEREATPCENPRMIEVPALTGRLGRYYFKPFWHASREEAVKHAEELRERKLQSLRRAIKKLEQLSFDLPKRL